MPSGSVRSRLVAEQVYLPAGKDAERCGIRDGRLSVCGDTPGGGKTDVPQWNGEPDKLTTYRFDVLMFMKSVRKTDRYICGPQLVRGLGPRLRIHAEAYESLDELDAMDLKTGSAPAGIPPSSTCWESST